MGRRLCTHFICLWISPRSSVPFLLFKKNRINGSKREKGATNSTESLLLFFSVSLGFSWLQTSTKIVVQRTEVIFLTLCHRARHVNVQSCFSKSTRINKREMRLLPRIRLLHYVWHKEKKENCFARIIRIFVSELLLLKLTDSVLLYAKPKYIKAVEKYYIAFLFSKVRQP